QNPTHTYATPGTYTVCLTTTNVCGSDSSCSSVTVVCPIPGTAFADSTLLLAAFFTDNTTDNPTNWLWDFGDGNTSTQQNPQHTYAMPGSYLVCLTTTNSCGTDSSCRSVTVDCPLPTSSFSSSANQLALSFTDMSGGNPNTYSWDFGDGNSSAMQNPQHTYATPGTYVVCLSVFNSCGVDNSCDTITVSCPAPASGYTFTGMTNGTVDFTDQTTGGATAWSWDFGDGGSSIQQNPQHTYSVTGTYTVCLVASSICGADTFCQMVTVSVVGIEDGQFSNFEVWPNPATSMLHFQVDLAPGMQAEARLLDARGKTLRIQSLHHGQIQNLNIENLAAGLYFLQVISEDGTATRKIRIE
ncbi:MAG: PKD domain-containing protein, partial [Bacteroidota bacterium]